MTRFIPEQPSSPMRSKRIPYFEDSRDQKLVPGRYVTRSVSELQADLVATLNAMGASGVRFQVGTYPGNPPRQGMRITFLLNAAEGRIDCAALPLRKASTAKADRALAQALYLLNRKLEGDLYAAVYEPTNNIPLLPYLLGPGDKTVAELIIGTQQNPLLAAGKTQS